MTEPLKAGWCQHCREECRDRLGSDIYPGEPSIADLVFWECPFCGARVHSDKDGKPIGTAANEELQRARMLLEARINPIWELASHQPDYASARTNPDKAERMKALAIIKRTAKKRLWDFLAAHLQLEAFNLYAMDLEQCREAWRALKGKTYADIREWAKTRSASRSAAETDPA